MLLDNKTIDINKHFSDVIRIGKYYQNDWVYVSYPKRYCRNNRINVPIYCGIYLIENLINHKIYIGQSVDIRKRWMGHVNFEGKTSLIDKSIQKYGEENFACWMIKDLSHEEFDRELMNSYEYLFSTLYIECYTPNGYNLNRCGEGGFNMTQMKEISCYDVTGRLVKTFPSLTEAQRWCGCSSTGFLQGVTAGGYYWKLGHNLQIEVVKPRTGPMGGIPVFQYDLITGDLIAEYQNASAAAKSLNIRDGDKNICAACNHKIKSCWKYYWSYEKITNYFDKYPKTDYYTRETKIDKFDLNNNFIETFISMGSAAKSVNTTKGNIYACCHGIRKTCKGYIWKYHSEGENKDE